MKPHPSVAGLLFLVMPCCHVWAQAFVYPVGNSNERPTHALSPNGYQITQGFMNHVGHTGVDLANGNSGGEVRAIGTGNVSFVSIGYSFGFGNVVIIRHDLPEGVYYSLYAHLQDDSVLVTQGDPIVTAGQPIAKVGSTGASTNPHLHFAVKLINTLGCGAIKPGHCTSGDTFANYYAAGPLQFVADHQVSQNIYIIQPGPEGKDTAYGTVFATNGQPNDANLYDGGWGDWYYDYFEFDLTGAPSAAQTTKAEFHVYAEITPHDPALQIMRITESWTEIGVTLSNNPASVFYKNFGPVSAGWNAVDITDLYKGWKNGTHPNFGIKLAPTQNFNTNGSLASSDNSNFAIRPKLVITGSTLEITYPTLETLNGQSGITINSQPLSSPAISSGIGITASQNTGDTPLQVRIIDVQSLIPPHKSLLKPVGEGGILDPTNPSGNQNLPSCYLSTQSLGNNPAPQFVEGGLNPPIAMGGTSGVNLAYFHIRIHRPVRPISDNNPYVVIIGDPNVSGLDPDCVDSRVTCFLFDYRVGTVNPF